ncbi:MAG TPA: DUF4824 family protein [Rhodocyclaceae bacterium]
MISRRFTLAAGAALILVANAVALGGVAYNRAGEPESRIVLSQRELARPWGWRANKENSGLALRIDWRVNDPNMENLFGYYSGGYGGMPGWLDEKRMADLGFDVAAIKAGPSRHGWRAADAEREVLVVLELAGAGWQEALERARRHLAEQESRREKSPADKELIEAEKRARENLAREENDNSRLFAVDVGTNLDGLRARYADRGRYMILKTKLSPALTTRNRQPVVTGHLGALAVAEVNVPHAMRATFDAIPAMEARPNARKPPFSATLAVGQRLEPWLEAVGAP